MTDPLTKAYETKLPNYIIAELHTCEPKYTQKTHIRKTRKRNADARQHIRKKAH